MTTLRELWDAGRPTIGGWCTLPSAFSAELMGRSGFDWVCIDTQHGLVGYDQMVLMLQGLAITGTPAFVRVRWNEPGEIMKALDAGAQGVVVPMVNSAEEAVSAVAASRYPPRATAPGGRSGQRSASTATPLRAPTCARWWRS
jgi:4-hydroxy-2-oxoheptanedioate aldolase